MEHNTPLQRLGILCNKLWNIKLNCPILNLTRLNGKLEKEEDIIIRNISKLEDFTYSICFQNIFFPIFFPAISAAFHHKWDLIPQDQALREKKPHCRWIPFLEWERERSAKNWIPLGRERKRDPQRWIDSFLCPYLYLHIFWFLDHHEICISNPKGEKIWIWAL